MDIKNISRNILSLPNAGLKETADVGPKVKTENTGEREGNGQSAGEEQRKRRNLTTEEIDEAVTCLAALPGVKDNLLTVRVERNAEGIPSILIADRTGKTVRRIPESDITLVTANREKKNGHLLNKAL